MRGMRASGLDFEVAIENIKTAFYEDEKPLIKLGLEKFTENGDTYGIRDKRTQEVYVEPIYDWVDDVYNARTMRVQVRDVEGNRMATELYFENEDEGDEARASKLSNTEKTATYFDTYDLIATITVPDGRSNGTYSEIINILNDAQIKYREDERFNEKPDRNVLKILIKKEDAEALEILNKEYKDLGITFIISTVSGEFANAKMAVKK